MTNRKTTAPNTILPNGGRVIKPAKKIIGNWVCMTYDAAVTINGLRWLRVKGGMGDNNDREDWVCDLPGVCISVHDYQWRPPYWGVVRVKSFEEAVRHALEKALRRALYDEQKLEQKLSTLTGTIVILKRVVK